VHIQRASAHCACLLSKVLLCKYTISSPSTMNFTCIHMGAERSPGQAEQPPFLIGRSHTKLIRFLCLSRYLYQEASACICKGCYCWKKASADVFALISSPHAQHHGCSARNRDVCVSAILKCYTRPFLMYNPVHVGRKHFIPRIRVSDQNEEGSLHEVAAQFAPWRNSAILGALLASTSLAILQTRAEQRGRATRPTLSIGPKI
jgi:hypothetical protein